MAVGVVTAWLAADIWHAVRLTMEEVMSSPHHSAAGRRERPAVVDSWILA